LGRSVDLATLPYFGLLIYLGFAMSQLVLLLWFLNVVIDTAGHLAFKKAAVADHEDEWQRWRLMLSAPPIWIGVICFGLEFVVWLALLSLIPLSLAVMLGAINIAVVMVAGKLIFGERLDRLRVAGMSLVTLGVALAGWGA
jgi:drug/metabolite transporter (DMT)-like permease